MPQWALGALCCLQATLHPPRPAPSATTMPRVPRPFLAAEPALGTIPGAIPGTHGQVQGNVLCETQWAVWVFAFDGAHPHTLGLGLVWGEADVREALWPFSAS